MNTLIDVICYGSLIPDRVLRLPRFPQPGEGIHALDETRYLGGEPGNVGGHLATWGVGVALAGNNLGDDSDGDFVQQRIATRGNTRSFAQIEAGTRTPVCYLWVTPDGERTIVPSWPRKIGWTLPDDATIAAARMVSVSIYGPGMDLMIDRARQHHKPLALADITGSDDPRLPGAAIVTTSRAVLQRRWNISDARSWMAAVHDRSGALVVVSNGSDQVIALSADGCWITATPPRIDPVDTTGAGDALKAGLIYGWLQGWPIDQALPWAIAAASLQCLDHGPCEHPAAIDQVAALVSTIKLVSIAY